MRVICKCHMRLVILDSNCHGFSFFSLLILSYISFYVMDDIIVLFGEYIRHWERIFCSGLYQFCSILVHENPLSWDAKIENFPWSCLVNSLILYPLVGWISFWTPWYFWTLSTSILLDVVSFVFNTNICVVSEFKFEIVTGFFSLLGTLSFWKSSTSCF